MPKKHIGYYMQLRISLISKATPIAYSMRIILLIHIYYLFPYFNGIYLWTKEFYLTFYLIMYLHKDKARLIGKHRNRAKSLTKFPESLSEAAALVKPKEMQRTISLKRTF